MDVLGILAGVLLCLLCSYVLGYRRIFWEDEMLGWMLIRDPSFHHMIAAWKQGADGGGITFYVTCRAWFWLFGPSEISFRFYSATCFALAFAVTWITARCFYRTRTVAFGLFTAWFFSPPVVTHLAEGRFYGLLMLATALVVWFTLVKARLEQSSTLSLCVLAFLLNSLLTTSHVLGVLYSVMLLASLVLLDWRHGRFRPLLYLSTSLAWLCLLPEHEAIRATVEVGKPYFWTTPPDLSRFLGSFCEFSTAVAAIMVLLIVLAVVSRLRKGEDGHSLLRRARGVDHDVVLLVGVLFLLPFALTLEALVGTSLFINRYLMPLTVAQALLLCELIEVVDWKRFLRTKNRRQRRQVELAAGITYVIVLFGWIFGHLIRSRIGVEEFSGKLTARLPKAIPVLCEDAFAFTAIIGRQHSSGVNYTYLLDWQQSTSASAPRLEVTQYHLMENWRKAGYFSGSIQKRNEFLQQHQRFLILHWTTPQPSSGPIIGNPLAKRFAATPGFQAVLFRKEVVPEVDVWLVCRGSCSP